MGFRKFIFMAGPGLPLLLAALTAGPAVAQFREILPESAPQPRIEIQLSPTRQHFTPPKQPTTDPAPEPIPATTGEPTPAPTAPVDARPSTTSDNSSPEVTASPSGANPAPVLDAVTSATPKPIPTPTPSAELAPAAESEPSPSDIPAAPTQPSNPFAAFHRKETASIGSATDAPTPPAITAPAPIVFNQLVPGESTVADALQRWGKPVQELVDEQGKQLLYRAPGFRQVNLITASDGDTISSILIHLVAPMSVEDLAKQLEVTTLRPLEIRDDSDALQLGRGYPERGLLMTYASDDSVKSDAPRMVSQLALEPIAGDLYRMRAEKANDRKHAANLADLEEATRLNPQDAKAYWLQSELLSLIGRNNDAWTAVSVATRIAPDNPLYRLTYARLNAGQGNLLEALAATRTIAEDTEVPNIVRARAEYQLGNLSAIGPEMDMQDAINHHLKAIELASKHLRSTHGDTRRMAKDILVDSHLAVAQDIALGNFQRQRDVVPRWLTRATELTEDFIAEDGGEELMRMEIYRTTLAVYSVIEGNFDASIATEEAIKEAQRLVAQANDRLYQFQVERELSETLYHAAKVEHRCGRWKSAQQYASNAVVLLEGEKSALQPSLFDNVMAAQLYYLTGSIGALQEEDHAEAAKWYRKALPTFEDKKLGSLVDTSGFGDLMVSMGVSFWESGDKNEAVRLTQLGADMMQQGVEAGTIEMLALSVPYGNLAAMHQDLGNGDQAKHFATMLAKVERDAATLQR
jgi:tetratricopeptide (TPR) repeat protein